MCVLSWSSRPQNGTFIYTHTPTDVSFCFNFCFLEVDSLLCLSSAVSLGASCVLRPSNWHWHRVNYEYNLQPQPPASLTNMVDAFHFTVISPCCSDFFSVNFTNDFTNIQTCHKSSSLSSVLFCFLFFFLFPFAMLFCSHNLKDLLFSTLTICHNFYSNLFYSIHSFIFCASVEFMAFSLATNLYDLCSINFYPCRLLFIFFDYSFHLKMYLCCSHFSLSYFSLMLFM